MQPAVWTAWKERSFFRIKRLQHTAVPGSEGKQCSNFSQEFQGSDRQGLNQVPKAYAGNLQYHIENWRKLTSDPWILETVTGYHLEFDSIPKQTGIPKPPPFGGFEKQLIDDEIVTLKSKGASKEVTYCSNEFLSNIILVTKKTGDMRPVINLKPLNVFVQKIHFKMENINTALHTIAPGDYLVSIDLKDAYFSILIFKPHRKFLRFKWSDQTYEFTCLPFGYSLAPRVFTKVLQPVISHLRENSYRVVIFLDDIHFIGSSVEECLSKLSFLRDLLQSLGFVINVNKSQLFPVTRIVYLGFIIDIVSMTLSLPDEKVDKILCACQNLLTCVNPSVREVAHGIETSLQVH